MTASSSSLRVAILGAGKIALDHVAVLHKLGHKVTVGCSTGVTSPRWKAFASAAPEARFEPDGRAMLQASSVDAIVACLPWNVTEKWLPWLLATPKPVLIEKPIGLSSRAVRAALAEADARPEGKFVAFNRRFYAPVQRMKERLRQGGLKAATITVSEALDRLIERYSPEILPHVLAYSSCHILDAALYLLGAMKTVRVYGHAEQGYPAPFRSLNGLLETESGIPVGFSINADDPVAVGIQFHFDDKTAWVLSPMERLVAYRGYDVVEPTPEFRIRRYTPKPFLEITVDTSSKPGFLEQMSAFTSGKGGDIAATPRESVELLSLIEAVQQAAA